MPEGIQLMQELPKYDPDASHPDFHKDPKKMAGVRTEEVDPLANAQDRAILDQIARADILEIGDIMDRLSESHLADASLFTNPDFMKKLNAAYNRYQELMKPENKTLH